MHFPKDFPCIPGFLDFITNVIIMVFQQSAGSRCHVKLSTDSWFSLELVV